MLKLVCSGTKTGLDEEIVPVTVKLKSYLP